MSLVERIQFAMLPRRVREEVRELSRMAYITSGPGHAKSNAEQAIRSAYKGIFTSIMVALAVKLGIKLIEHWFSLNLKSPGSVYLSSEPGA